jgi:hypothetical protein
MRGHNPSADSAAGIAGRRRTRFPSAMSLWGFGGGAPNCEATHLFWREQR